jgi:putative hemolysin
MDLTLGFILLGIFIILSGFFSGVEAAFLSLNNLKIRRLIEKKEKNAEIVKELKDDSHKLIITLLVGNNVANIGGSALATAISLQIFGSDAVGLATAVATGVMTFIILITGEIVPKSIAIQHSKRICLLIARPIRNLKTLLFPIIITLDFITKRLMGKMAKSQKRPLITEEELKTFVEIGEEAGSIDKDEKEMIHNIFKLDDQEAREVMTPKINMITIDGNLTLGASLDFIASSRYSRIPVIEDENENISKILNIKDILVFIKDQNLDIKIKDLAKEALIIPETKPIDDLLKEMQNKRRQLSIVVDEYGVVTGLVTIEDILEEIVGEIYDENDIVDENIKQLDKKNFIVKGETPIDEINKTLEFDINADNGFDTISGYILKEHGNIPKENEEINLPKFKVIVNSVENNRIVNMKIIKKSK